MPYSAETLQFITQTYDVFVGKILNAFPAARARGQVAAFFSRHKETLLKQVFFNLGLNCEQPLDAAARKKFEQELEKILPLFGGFPSFFAKGDALEVLADQTQPKKKRKIIARNYLRLFMRGSKVGVENDWVWNSPLFAKELYETIAVKGDPKLLQQVRAQIQEYLTNAYRYIKSRERAESKLDEEGEGREKQQAALFQLHLFPLLASLAFFDYPDKSTILIPVQIDGYWQQVEYTIDKLDLSPKPDEGGLNGIIGSLLEDEDIEAAELYSPYCPSFYSSLHGEDAERSRFYMYGLSPLEGTKKAQPILLLNGTPHPACPGGDLAVIHNFGIGKSIGETHNWSAIHHWVEERENIAVYCHSKGGSMGQILAAEKPERIASVEALSSAGLHSTTLKRLRETAYGEGEAKLTWDQRVQAKQDHGCKIPRIALYQQPGDPVADLEQGFLAGTAIHRIITNKEGPSLNAYPIPAFFSRIWEGHSLPSLGHEMVGVVKSSCEQENKRKLRSILDTAKGIQNYFASFEGKIALILKLYGKKINRFLHRHRVASTIFLYSLTVLVLGILMVLATYGIGVLAPVLLGLVKVAGSQAAGLALLFLTSTFMNVGLIYFNVIPKVLRFAFNLGLTVLGKVYSLFSLTALLLLSTPSIIKNGAMALYEDPQPLKDFGKYLLSLQFIPDLISGIFQGLAKVGEAFYIAAALINRSLSSPGQPEKPVNIEGYSKIHTGLRILPAQRSSAAEEKESPPLTVRSGRVSPVNEDSLLEVAASPSTDFHFMERMRP